MRALYAAHTIKIHIVQTVSWASGMSLSQLLSMSGWRKCSMLLLYLFLYNSERDMICMICEINTKAKCVCAVHKQKMSTVRSVRGAQWFLSHTQSTFFCSCLLCFRSQSQVTWATLHVWNDVFVFAIYLYICSRNKIALQSCVQNHIIESTCRTHITALNWVCSSKGKQK